MNPVLSQHVDQFSLEIYVLDAESLRILFLNKAAQDNIGYTLDELLTHTILKLVPHGTIHDLKAELLSLHNDSATREILLGNMVTRKNGSRYPVDIRVQLIQYEGKPAYLGLVQDATEKQLALDQLHYVLKGSSLGFWDWNPGLDSYYVDDRWLEILGYERGEIPITRHSIFNLIIDADRKSVNDAFDHFMMYDDNFSLEFRCKHKLGHAVWVRSSAAVVTRDLRSGSPLRLCGTHEDMTRHKQGEAEREEFYKFFQMSSDLMMISRPDGSLNKVNPAVFEIMGYTQEELLSMHIIDWVHPEDRAMTQKEHLRQSLSGAIINFENRCLCKDGSIKWLSWHATFNLSEGVSYATARDVTESKKIQLELKQQQELYAALVTNTDDVIMQFDREHRHTYVNSPVIKSLQLAPEEFIGKTHQEMGFPDALCEIWEDAIERVFISGKPVSTFFDMVNANGPVRIDWNVYPGLVVNGEVKRVFSVSRDITQHMNIENELRKMQKLNSLGVLAGGIAHDFNNILTVLFGNIALAKSSIPPEHKGFSSLEQAEKAFLRATHLTSQLLTFAKGGDPVKQDVSISSFIEEVVQFDLSGSNVKLEFETAPNLWKARVDKGQISQVFSNLATNANQAMPQGGRLYISITNVSLRFGDIPGLDKGQYLKFMVEDSGVGIKDSDIDKIFDPYFTTKKQGSGLGLATVYSIVSKHGGSISVSSSPGNGAIFSIYLPASNSEAEFGEDTRDDITAQTNTSSRILIMDDEAMICELSSTYLSGQGYKVETAKDGKQAINLYTQAFDQGEPFDCVIMDLTIPGGMSGKEALDEILKLHPQAKAIVSSGYAADPVMANYQSFGFKGSISKPFYISTLHAEIKKVLGENTIKH